jgi:hypothetical protein
MIMADVLKIFFLVLGAASTVIGYWLFFEACAGGMVTRCSRTYDTKPFKALFLGLLLGLPATFAGIAMLQNGGPVVKGVGAVVLMTLVFIGLLGSTGLARNVGNKLSINSAARSPWVGVLSGGIILCCVYLLPILGWFVMIPATLGSGIGAAFLSRKEKPQAPTAEMAIPGAVEGATA